MPIAAVKAAYDHRRRPLRETVEPTKAPTPTSCRIATPTAAHSAAVKAEAAARARLPPDTRGLVIIMSEIGRGGMNGAVIAIEEARELADAIDSETPTPTSEPDATPTSEPDASPSTGPDSSATP